MKKTFKIMMMTCLLLFAVCGASVSVNARSYYYYRGQIEIDPEFPDSTFDANDQIEIPFVVTRYLSNNTTDLLSKYYCDIYGPSGSRISSTSGYLSDMTASTLKWTVFDNHTPRSMGEYTVKYYTSSDTGGTCHFYVKTISGSAGSGLRWALDNETQELVISGFGSVPGSGAPWRDYENNIQSIVIQEGVTGINEFAFYDLTSLTSVSLPSTLTVIGNFAFNNCPNLTTVNFSEGLTQIGKCAFQKCSFLQNVKLPSTLRILGNSAFEKTAIKEIIIPSGVTSLAMDVFEDCYYLEKITIPVTVREINIYAFSNCSSLRTVIYEGTQEQWERINIGSSGNEALEYAALKTVQPQIVLSKTKLKRLENGSAGIKLTWNKVNKASGYYIYRKTGSNAWKKIATVKNGTTVSYIDKKTLTNGTQYSYMVRAYNGSVVSTGNSLNTVRITAPVITACSSKSGRTITLKWKKNSKITGYEIKYATGSSSKTVKVKNKNTVKYVLKNLKKGKTYTVRMRAYKTVNKKTYYSTWSSAKKSVAR